MKLVVPRESTLSKISYPTINIVVPKDEEKEGVYVCEVKLDPATARGGSGGRFFGAGYIGEKEGLSAGEFICEVFLFGDIGDVYGQFAGVKLLKKIRDVQKPKNLEELSALIECDVKFAKEYLNGQTA